MLARAGDFFGYSNRIRDLDDLLAQERSQHGVSLALANLSGTLDFAARFALRSCREARGMWAENTTAVTSTKLRAAAEVPPRRRERDSEW